MVIRYKSNSLQIICQRFTDVHWLVCIMIGQFAHLLGLFILELSMMRFFLGIEIDLLWNSNCETQKDKDDKNMMESHFRYD